MYHIYTVNPDETIDFAAQELKKYLRMMMPRVGEIPVFYQPEAKAGFRLGLMADFGIDPEVKDLHLDDVGVGHGAVVDDVILAHQGTALERKALVFCHVNLLVGKSG